MNYLGRLIYLVFLPLIRIYLRHTSRVYGLVICKGEVLVVKNWLGRQLWQLPGGGIKRRENAVDALARELKEELGIKVSGVDTQPLTSGRWRTDRLGFKYRIYQIKLGKKPELKLLKPEVREALWLAPKSLISRQTASEVTAALKRGNLL